MSDVSLTSHLSDPGSPVHAWFCATLPNATTVRPWRAITPASRHPDCTPGGTHLMRAPRTWPMRVPPVGDCDASTAGTALDYRLRLLLDPRFDPNSSVAALGAAQLARWFLDDHGLDQPDLYQPFELTLDDATVATLRSGTTPGFVQLTDAIRDVATRLPARGLGSRAVETRAARLCWLLAMFEQAYRAGVDRRWPLPAADADASLRRLLRMVPDAAATQIGAMTRLFVRSQPRFLAARRVLSGMVFAQSAALRGADADLLLDGLLLEVKATVDPHLDRDRLWQLAGYALGDTPDGYRIRSVGIYFARHGQLLTWPLPGYLSALAARDDVPVAGLRGEFSQLLPPPTRHRRPPSRTTSARHTT